MLENSFEFNKAKYGDIVDTTVDQIPVGYVSAMVIEEAGVFYHTPALSERRSRFIPADENRPAGVVTSVSFEGVSSIQSERYFASSDESLLAPKKYSVNGNAKVSLLKLT